VASSDTLPEAHTARTAATAPGLFAGLAIMLKAGAILLAAYLTALAIVLLEPDQNDYALAARVQHNQLTAPVSRKIVLVGGSNLNFGVDSAYIEDVTGCHVANMGINGFLGVRFMLNEADPNLRRGDIAVLAFEYDAYMNTVDGRASAQVMVSKSVPEVFRYFTPRQRLRMAQAVPYVAQQKILGRMEETYDWLVKGVNPLTDVSLIRQVESLAGVTRHGDLVSHLGIEWPYGFEDGLDFTALGLDPDVVDLLQDFAQRMQDRGVHVVMSYTPVMRSYYARYRAEIEDLHARLDAAHPLDPPSPPSAFIYDEELFFDTVYHLNAEGRALRTSRLVEDIRRQLEEDAECSPRSAPSNGGIADD
jgi:hypothetical protein